MLSSPPLQCPSLPSAPVPPPSSASAPPPSPRQGCKSLEHHPIQPLAGHRRPFGRFAPAEGSELTTFAVNGDLRAFLTLVPKWRKVCRTFSPHRSLAQHCALEGIATTAPADSRRMIWLGIPQLVVVCLALGSLLWQPLLWVLLRRLMRRCGKEQCKEILVGGWGMLQHTWSWPCWRGGNNHPWSFGPASDPPMCRFCAGAGYHGAQEQAPMVCSEVFGRAAVACCNTVHLQSSLVR